MQACEMASKERVCMLWALFASLVLQGGCRLTESLEEYTHGDPESVVGSGGSAGSFVEGASCAGGLDCGGKSCCSAILVPGGTFPMGRGESGYDVCPSETECDGDELPEHDARVSDFYLDEYEVTVGRFRKFVEQFDGTPPPDGAGAHPLIADSGWKGIWNEYLAPSRAGLIRDLKCDLEFSTWRDTPSGTEALPINCVSWYEAFAFCEWDGGRLPTEAEWEYASAGGMKNWLYPWEGGVTPDNRAAFDCEDTGPGGCVFADIAVVGSFSEGVGRWGHKDLAGNMWEWVLDAYDATWYLKLCDNCANLNAAPRRVRRGGGWRSKARRLRVANRGDNEPTFIGCATGFRCARNP